MDISVIVPTHNSKDYIKECLKSIKRQKLNQKFEVIVVNDGSTDSTAQIAQDLNVKVFSKINQGPAIARNFGAQKAKGKILVFIDDDCIADKNWLKEMVEPFSDQNVAGVQGAYKTNQKELCARFGQAEIEDRYDRIKNSKNVDWVGSYSAAYKRDIFFEHQGYDSSFPTASGEDPELSFKIGKAGHKLVFNPKAHVFHTHEASFKNYFKKKFFRAYWRILLYRKHTDKIVSDSYTPQILKVQILFFYLFLLTPVIVFIFFNSDLTILITTEIIISALCFLTMLPFILKVIKNDFKVGLVSPFVIGGRSIAFGLGLIAGVVKGVWLR